MAIVRINDLPLEASPVAGDFLAIDGATTRKTSIQDAVEIGRPIAGQAEAENGVQNTKVMTPLRVKQGVTSYGLTKAVYDPGGVNADAFALSNMTGTINSGQIAPNAVTITAMADNSVDTAELVDGAVSNAKIAGLAVGTTKIANDAVDNTKLANMATATVKGRLTAGTGDPEDVPVSSLASLLEAVSYGTAQGLTITQKNLANVNMGAFLSGYVNGGAADYTVLTSDRGKHVDVNATAAVRVINLPSAASAGVGFPISLKKAGTGFNTVTVTANGADTIDGLATFVLRLPNQTVVLECVNSTSWRVVAESGTVISGSNANGDYTRYANGDQVCYSPIIVAGAVNVATGSVFALAAAVNWTYPVAFAGTRVAASAASSVTSNWAPCNSGTGNLTATAAQLIGANSSGTSRDVVFQAVGKWF